MSFVHKELTGKIIGCSYTAFNTLGAGYDETIYHKAFAIELAKQGFDVQNKLTVPVVYRERKLLDFEIDLIINDLIVLELKEIQSDFLPIHYNQIITYLKATKKRLGYLFNFGLQQVYYKRILFDEKPKRVKENYDEVKNMSDNDKQKLKQIRKAILTVYNEFGLGYDYRVYREALKVELNLMEIELAESVPVDIDYNGKFLKEFEIKFWLVDNQFLLTVFAGTGEIRAYDKARMKSYLRRLNLTTGIIAFWGKHELKILALGNAD